MIQSGTNGHPHLDIDGEVPYRFPAVDLGLLGRHQPIDPRTLPDKAADNRPAWVPRPAVVEPLAVEPPAGRCFRGSAKQERGAVAGGATRDQPASLVAKDDWGGWGDGGGDGD